MATIRLVEGFGGESYLDIDTDAQDRVVTVRGRNVYVDAMRTGRTSGPRYQHTFLDAEESIAIPTSPAGRIQLTVGPRGELVGVDATIEMFAPGSRG